MAGTGTLTGDKCQNPVSGQLNGFTGNQIFGHQQEFSVGDLETCVAAENIVNTLGHIPDVGGTGLHVLVVHGGENGGKFLTGVQSGIGSGSAAFDGHGYTIQIIQIVQHQQLHFHNGSMLFADLDLCLFIQGSQLLPGSFQSAVELCLLHSGIAGGNRGNALCFPVNHSRADGYTGKNGKTKTLLHGVLLTLPAR